MENYQDLLVSGSSEKNILFCNKNGEIIEKINIKQEIIKLLSCPCSEQMMIFLANGEIIIMNMKPMSLQNAPKIAKKVKYSSSA